MKTEHHLDLPRRLQIDFSGVVQRCADHTGGEVTPQQMWDVFAAEYLTPRRLILGDYATSTMDGKVELVAGVAVDGVAYTLTGIGNGPIDAFVHALTGLDIGVRVPRDYAEHALSSGGDAQAAAYVECCVDGVTRWGVGVDPNIVTASLRAVVNASDPFCFHPPPTKMRLVISRLSVACISRQLID